MEEKMRGEEGLEAPQQIRILTPDSEIGLYANMAQVTFTPEEAIIHFAQRDPNDPSEGRSVVRVFLSLAHAKRLTAVLARSVKRHESVFGEIGSPISLSPEGERQLIERILQMLPEEQRQALVDSIVGQPSESGKE